jgi:hypothetical protein
MAYFATIRKLDIFDSPKKLRWFDTHYNGLNNYLSNFTHLESLSIRGANQIQLKVDLPGILAHVFKLKKFKFYGSRLETKDVSTGVAEE